MSDLEEPPAKVLKIDKIDGVNHVTELSEIPANIDSIDSEMMGEESGIIEGGADDGQEEWLSDGILTDDDYNPASQNDGDRTDSQLSSHDEDQHNGSMEHLDTTAESEGNTVNGSNILDNDANTTESDANMPESKENQIGMKANIDYSVSIESQTYTQLDEMEMDGNITDCETNNTNITKRELDITESKANITESKANITESKAYITRSQANMKLNAIKTEVTTAEENIEETMKHLDGAKEDSKIDIFDTLLIKKAEIKSEPTEKPEAEPEQDDANDTDDLLRMLSEDNSKTKKKMTKTVKDIRKAAKKENASSDDDDDDFVFEGATLNKLKAAKSALAKKQPAMKAEPEDMEDGDDETEISGDEKNIITTKRMVHVKARTVRRPQPPLNGTPNVVERPPRMVQKPLLVVQKPPAVVHKPPLVVQKPSPVVQKQISKNIVNLVNQPLNIQVKSQTPPVNQLQAKRHPPKPILKTSTPSRTIAAAKTTVKPPEVKKEVGARVSFKPPEVKTPAPFKSFSILKPIDKKMSEQVNEHDEIIDDADFLENDEFNMDEDEFELEGEMSRSQRIMRPEMMDEEVPSDGDSHSEDGSLYDELPSSGSEDMDDWFQLDIRAEKAGDYIPLLGSRAKELLLEEKRRVTSRLQTLKQSLSALTDGGKKQAEQLKDATMALAELDDMLKAS